MSIWLSGQCMFDYPKRDMLCTLLFVEIIVCLTRKVSRVTRRQELRVPCVVLLLALLKFHCSFQCPFTRF